jgi:hypothetical protein
MKNLTLNENISGEELFSKVASEYELSHKDKYSMASKFL